MQKLKGLLSDYQSNEITNQIHNNRVKFHNEEIYYNIDAIHRAIDRGKKVKFIYHHRKMQDGVTSFDVGKKITVSPYALAWSGDKYYMIANHEEYDKISNYRIDRIKTIEIVDEEIRPYEEVDCCAETFDISNHLMKSINMFSGKQETVELLCQHSVLEVLIDQFGTEVMFLNNGKKQFVAVIKVYISDGLVDWLVQHGDTIYVKFPISLREKVVKKLKMIQKNYKQNSLNDS